MAKLTAGVLDVASLVVGLAASVGLAVAAKSRDALMATVCVALMLLSLRVSYLCHVTDHVSKAGLDKSNGNT